MDIQIAQAHSFVNQKQHCGTCQSFFQLTGTTCQTKCMCKASLLSSSLEWPSILSGS